MQYDRDFDDLVSTESRAKGQTVSNRVRIAVPLTLTDSNFEQALQKYPQLVVDFWTPWCGPCRMLAPAIEQLASELAGKVVIGKLDVDENPRVARAFEIQSIPTVLIFNKGQIVDGFKGIASKAQIKSLITSCYGLDQQ